MSTRKPLPAAVAAVAAVAAMAASSAFAAGPYSETGVIFSLGELPSATTARAPASFAAPGIDPYSEAGGIQWLASVAQQPGGPARAPGTTLQCAHALADGTTVHVFPNGTMGMEDRFGRTFSMAAGTPMQAADGNTIVMKGNELQRTEGLLDGAYRDNDVVR